MSAYCTNADVAKALENNLLAGLTASSGTTPSATRIDNEIAIQSAFMDSFFVGRYVIPITAAAITALLVPHCVNLVLFSLFQDRLQAERYRSIQLDRDATIDWLKAVSKGEIGLVGATEVTVTVTSTDVALVMGFDTQQFGGGTVIL